MLQITSRDDGHKHGIYLGPRGRGLTSPGKKNGHTHEVFKDEQGNWFIREADGHSHEIEDIVRKEPRKKKKKDEEIVSETHSLFVEADQLDGDCIDAGQRSWDIYLGEKGQWDSAERARMERERRAAITINESKKKVDLLSGHLNQNRTDITFKPTENGDEVTADLLNMLIKNVYENNNFEYEEKEAFKDELIPGRGILRLEQNFDRNPEGDIVIRHYPWDDVVFGPHNRPDQEDLEYLVKTTVFSKGKLEQLFPDKSKEIEAFMSINELQRFDDPHLRVKGRQYSVSRNKQRILLNGKPLVDIQRKEFLVFELWRREYRTVDVITFPVDNFVEDGTGISEKDLALIKSIDGIETFRKNAFDIRVVKVAGSVLLSNEIVDQPENAEGFDLEVAYADKHKNHFSGIIEQLKGPQFVLNHNISKITDMTRTLAAQGEYYDDDTFADESEATKYRKNRSKMSFLQKVRDVSKVPVPREGARFPTELAQNAQIMSDKMNIIAGIQDFSQAPRDTSGKALLIKRRESLVGNDYLFDNFNQMKKRLAKKIVAHIQDLYTPERVVRIVRATPESDPQFPNVVNASPEQIMVLFENLDLTRYDVALVESPQTETMKDFSFLALSELAQQGVPIPPEAIIENSPLPNKTRLIGQITEQREQAQQAEQAKQQSEVVKSLPDELKAAIVQQGGLNGQQPQAF